MARASGGTEVVIVGGGLSGLAVAAYLGRAAPPRPSVHVVEKAATLGGRARTTCRDGFSFNRGPHAIYLRGEAHAVLTELGVAMPGRPPALDGSALHGGVLHRLPVGSLSLVATTLFGLGAKAAASAWLARLPSIDAADLAGTSVSAWLDGRGVRADVRSLLEAFLRLSSYANSPGSFSAETAVRQFQKALGNVLYVDGGWQRLVDGLATAARSSGAVVETGARATALGREPGGRHAVHLADGRTLVADAVVLASPPREVARLLASAGVTAPRSIVDPVPVRMAALTVALAALPVERNRLVLGVDRPVYLSVHSAAARLAPEHGALIHLGKYLTGDETDAARDRAELEDVLDLAQPGWRTELVHAEYLPRMVVAERLDLAGEGGIAGRPPTELPGLPGLYLAGDWVRGGSWLSDASLGSARAVARSLLSGAAPRSAVA